jgi:hypothetical protein
MIKEKEVITMIGVLIELVSQLHSISFSRIKDEQTLRFVDFMSIRDNFSRADYFLLNSLPAR